MEVFAAVFGCVNGGWVLLKGDTPSTGTIALSELKGMPASSTVYKASNN